MTDAGAQSPHLDDGEQDQAAERAPLGPMVIHEIIRHEGEQELDRTPTALALSALAAGLSMGFSFLTLAMISAALPDAPWRRLVDSAGYSVGFLIVVLGRQQLFTETTLTALLPVLVRRDLRSLGLMLRLWAIVLGCNLIGTMIFARLSAIHGIFADPIYQAMLTTGRATMAEPFLPTLMKAVMAGWLIALMVWLLPSAGSARILIIVALTYVVALARLSHIVAGSTEAAFAVFGGGADWHGYLVRFFAPTLLGNTLGGVALVGLLNHAPLAAETQGKGRGGASGAEPPGLPKPPA